MHRMASQQRVVASLNPPDRSHIGHLSSLITCEFGTGILRNRWLLIVRRTGAIAAEIDLFVVDRRRMAADFDECGRSGYPLLHT